MIRDIFEILSNQHDNVRKALQILASTTAKDVKTRRDEGSRVALEVISHNEAETDTLYSRLLEISELELAVEKQQDEHEVANEGLRALLDMNVEDKAWLEHLKEIEQVIESHLADEEKLLFPLAKKYLDDSEAESLAKLFRHEQSLRKGLLKAA